MDLLGRLKKMNSRASEYYKNSRDKCFDKFYLLDRIFPPEKGMEKAKEKAYEHLAYALKEQNHILFTEAGDFLFEIGLHDWANHVFKIASIMKKHQMKKLNVRKLR